MIERGKKPPLPWLHSQFFLIWYQSCTSEDRPLLLFLSVRALMFLSLPTPFPTNQKEKWKKREVYPLFHLCPREQLMINQVWFFLPSESIQSPKPLLIHNPLRLDQGPRLSPQGVRLDTERKSQHKSLWFSFLWLFADAIFLFYHSSLTPDVPF